MGKRGSTGAAFSLFAFQDIITSVTGIMILITLILSLELIERVTNAASSPVRQLTQEMEQTEEDAAALQESVARNERLIEQLKQQLSQSEGRVDSTVRFDLGAVTTEAQNMSDVNDELATRNESLAAELQSMLDEQAEAESQAAASSDAEVTEQLLTEILELKTQLEEIRSSNRVIYNPSAGDNKQPWLVEVVDPDTILVATAGTEATRSQKLQGLRGLEQWLDQQNVSNTRIILVGKPNAINEFHTARGMVKSKGFSRGYELIPEEQTSVPPLEGP